MVRQIREAVPAYEAKPDLASFQTPAELDRYYHQRAIRAPLQDVAQTVVSVLGPKLTAWIIGVKDTKTIARWAAGIGTSIRDHKVEQRLRATYQMLDVIDDEQYAGLTRSWFIGMNPILFDQSPAEAVREGNFGEAFVAAKDYAFR